jgi:hypothetical protein
VGRRHDDQRDEAALEEGVVPEDEADDAPTLFCDQTGIPRKAGAKKTRSLGLRGSEVVDPDERGQVRRRALSNADARRGFRDRRAGR